MFNLIVSGLGWQHRVIPFDDGKTRPFFAGLLPEGRLRQMIAQQFQVSGQNDFALLSHLGGECAGAVTILEPAKELPVAARKLLSEPAKGFAGHPSLNQIITLIEQRAELTIRRLRASAT